MWILGIIHSLFMSNCYALAYEVDSGIHFGVVQN